MGDIGSSARAKLILSPRKTTPARADSTNYRHVTKTRGPTGVGCWHFFWLSGLPDRCRCATCRGEMKYARVILWTRAVQPLCLR